MIRQAVDALFDGINRLLDQAEHWLFRRKKATYGLSVMRICLGVAVLGSLAANAIDRHYVWGAGSRWLEPWVAADEFGFPLTTVFGETDSPAVFTAKYFLLIVVAALFTLGWRTRVVTPVLLVLVAGLLRLNPVATDAGDNIVRIMLLYLCFADVSAHWSLDARRRSRAGTVTPSRMPPWIGVLFHNVALAAVAAHIFVIYVTSGLSKVQGEMWQEGVGLYYPLRIGQYAPWPGLSELVYSSGIFVTIGSYVTVFVQVFFPLLLLRRGTRVVALLLIFAMHVSIAVTMALPWFSLAMLAGDAVFVRNDTYRALARWLSRSRRTSAADPPAADPATTEGGVASEGGAPAPVESPSPGATADVTPARPD